jgi:Secretion system C-terminal sorting domain
MKKFLLSLFAFFIVCAFNQVQAQCAVQNIQIEITGIDDSDPGNIKYTVDATFDMQNNSGNKWVFIHVWKQAGYPVGFFPASVSGTLNPPTNGTLAQGNLDEAILNIGFNNDLGTGGYLQYITDGNYLPDIAVNMTTGTGNVVLVAGAPAGYQRYAMSGITVATGQGIDDPLTLKANLWSSQAAQLSKAHCWTGELLLTFNDPSVIGSINCPSVSEDRTLTFFISSQSLTALGGTWKAYVDNDVDGFDILDYTGAQATPDAQGVFSGLTSTNTLPFQNIAYNGGNTLPVKPVYLIVEVTSPVGTFSNTLVYLISNTCSTLPVSLKSFNATQRSNKAILTWETELENNNDGFEIERRSAGNSQYQKIGFVDSKAPGGTGNGYSYGFDDNQMLTKGVTYYRLRQVDLDGKATYSEVKAVRTGNGGLLTISIYPNPSRGTANVTIPESAGKMDVSLDDYTGKSIQRWSGISVRNLQVNNMKPGIYMLRINFRETGETITERIIVQ